MDLKQQYNIGDIRFHTVLLFNQEAVEACGTICHDLYGIYPTWRRPSTRRRRRRSPRGRCSRWPTAATACTRSSSTRTSRAWGWARWTTRRSRARNVMKTMMVQSLRSVPAGTDARGGQRRRRAAGHADNTFTTGTNPFLADSDGDCFDDNFEALRADQGFVAGNDKDARGCDPASPLTPGCVCRDTDGDGLSQYAEALREDAAPDLVDSDGDGIPDGLEARYGLDPLDAQRRAGHGRGRPPGRGRDPRRHAIPPGRDRTFFDREGYQYDDHRATAAPRRQRLLRLHRVQHRAGDAAAARRACRRATTCSSCGSPRRRESGGVHRLRRVADRLRLGPVRCPRACACR